MIEGSPLIKIRHQGREVALNGQLSVDSRILWAHLRLVKVVDVLNVSSPKSALQNEWSVGSNEHGNCSGTSRGTRVTRCVDGDVGADCDGIASVPIRGLDPCDRVEEGSGSAVAGVSRINPFHVSVSTFLKKLWTNSIKVYIIWRNLNYLNINKLEVH